MYLHTKSTLSTFRNRGMEETIRGCPYVHAHANMEAIRDRLRSIFLFLMLWWFLLRSIVRIRQKYVMVISGFLFPSCTQKLYGNVLCNNEKTNHFFPKDITEIAGSRMRSWDYTALFWSSDLRRSYHFGTVQEGLIVITTGLPVGLLLHYQKKR